MTTDHPSTLNELRPLSFDIFIQKYNQCMNQQKMISGDEQPFQNLMEMAIELQSKDHLLPASDFFGKAFLINSNSADALMARLSCLATCGVTTDQIEIDMLKSLNENYHAFFIAKSYHLKDQSNSIKVLDSLQNKFEGFHTGSEADWLFIQHAMKFDYSFLVQKSLACLPIPKRLFMYWDKNPPDEISDNLSYHKSLGYFDVVHYSKESASDFLATYYGFDCRKMFLSLRHPSEESDFFRFHAINALGGFYLDADEQIISTETFIKTIPESPAVFILSQNPDGTVGPIHSAFFGSVKGHNVIEDCILTLYRNIFFYKNLSLWLKSGPGPLTRAISRCFYKTHFLGLELPPFRILSHDKFGDFIRAIDVSYRNDGRDWRIYELDT